MFKFTDNHAEDSSSKKDDQSPAAQNELDYEYYQSDGEFDLSKDSNSAAQNDESIPIDVNIFGKETAAPPPTPGEATEEGYAATHPVTATADEPEIPFTQAKPTIMKRRVKEITTIKRQKKNLEGGFLNIRVNVSSDNFPNISIKNRKPLLPNVQFINNEGCRRHHIVAWTLVKDVCIDCGKESFTEGDYARNRALDDVLGRYSHSEHKRSSVLKKKNSRSREYFVRIREWDIEYIGAVILDFIVTWIVPPVSIVLVLVMMSYLLATPEQKK